MKTKSLNLFLLIQLLALFILGSLLLSSCAKDDSTDEQPKPHKIIHSYFASASYGDLINVNINKTDLKIDYDNITTGQDGSLNYSVLSNPELNGIYQIKQGGTNYFAIESPGQMFVTSLPLGNIKNKLSFGMTSDVDFEKDYTNSDLAGRYIFAIFENVAPDEYEWGGYQVNADGTYSWKIGPEDPDEFDDQNGFSGDGGGTYYIDPENNSRIIFKDNESNDIFYGSVLPGKMMMIDMGTGNGFILGIKYPEQAVSQASVAGRYQWIDKTPEGYVGIGYYDIPASGTSLDYYMKYENNPYVSEAHKTAYEFKRSSKMKNLFMCKDDWDGDIFDTYLMVLPGESMIFFTGDEEGTIVSVGIGVKSK